MRRLMVLSALMCGLLGSGCMPFEAARYWIIQGELRDAATGANLSGADVAVRLVRSSDPIRDEGFGVVGRDGTFEVWVSEGWSYTFSFDPEAPLNPPLGDPPEEVEILVRTSTGEGTIIVAIDAMSVNRLGPITAEIQLPVLSVDLRPRIESTYTVGHTPSAIGVGDVDGDGDVDLVVVTEGIIVGVGRVVVLANHGDGSFAVLVQYGAGSRPSSVVTADLNGDESVDLAVLSSWEEDTLSVLLNDGQGEFTDHGSYPLTYPSGSPNALAGGDLNGDLSTDLAVAFNDGVSVFLNAGEGQFTDPITYPAGTYPLSLAASDLDADGDVDLAVADGGTFLFLERYPGGVSILLNKGDGTFGPPVRFPAGDGPEWVVAGDLNGNGHSDLAVVNRYSDDISILLNAGDGTFISGETYPARDPINIALGDLNQDGDLDVIVGESRTVRNVLVLANNGDGTFREAIRLTAGAYPIAIAVGNLDGNSHPDLVVVNSWGDNVSVFLNPQVP